MRDAVVREAFERLSTEYDARWPRVIPRYREFHEVVVRRAAAQAGAGDTGATWLELGCGTGELSRRLLEAMPRIRLHALDLSEAMVARARQKLAPWEDRVSFAVGNALELPLPERVAGVVSALAVHHLDGSEKRALFARLAGVLRPGGIFILGDAVNGETPAYTEWYEERWSDHMLTSGMNEEEVRSVLEDHSRNDRFSTLSEHVAWLVEAGFTAVECLWKHYLLVVLAAERPRSS